MQVKPSVETVHKGLQGIAAHHKAIALDMVLIKELQESSDVGSWRASLENFIKVLDEHFDAEQEFLKEVDFPNQDRHRHEHAMLMREAGAIGATLKAGNAVDKGALSSLLAGVASHLAVEEHGFEVHEKLV